MRHGRARTILDAMVTKASIGRAIPATFLTATLASACGSASRIESTDSPLAGPSNNADAGVDPPDAAMSDGSAGGSTAELPSMTSGNGLGPGHRSLLAA